MATREAWDGQIIYVYIGKILTLCIYNAVRTN